MLWIASSEAGSPLNSKVSVFINYYSKIELGLRNPSYNFMEKFKANFGDACVDEIFFKKKLHITCDCIFNCNKKKCTSIV